MKSLWELGRNRLFHVGYGNPLIRRQAGEAFPLLGVGRFRVLLCPTWFFGWQTTSGSFILCLIPALGFEWRF